MQYKLFIYYVHLVCDQPANIQLIGGFFFLMMYLVLNTNIISVTDELDYANKERSYVSQL